MAKMNGRISRQYTPIPFKGPASFPDLATALANLNAPSDANYVMWDSNWPINRDIEDVFNSLGANDILVLPERPQPYIIDSSEGFRASGVQSVTGRNGQLPIVSTYKGLRGARTWFAMARARRGILGLGPNAQIQMSASSWTQEPQIEDKGSNMSGWISPGRYWTNTSGVVQSELVGCQEKIIEAAYSKPYFGNFTLTGRDLGGVAYSGIAGSGTYERLNLTGAWHGFQAVPNGEAGAITTNGGTYSIIKCILGARDASGNRTGSSPIMINASTGGSITDTDTGETSAGMLTLWNCSGLHTFTNVHCRFNYGPGLNLEQTLSGFQLVWNGGSIWSDYQGGGGKGPKPADQGTNGQLHINLHATGTSAKITLNGVDLDTGPAAGKLCMQAYGSETAGLQQISDINCYDKAGNAIPVKVYGIN